MDERGLYRGSVASGRVTEILLDFLNKEQL
jgi:hypothetical protein